MHRDHTLLLASQARHEGRAEHATSQASSRRLARTLDLSPQCMMIPHVAAYGKVRSLQRLTLRRGYHKLLIAHTLTSPAATQPDHQNAKHASLCAVEYLKINGQAHFPVSPTDRLLRWWITATTRRVNIGEADTGGVTTAEMYATWCF
jgi:hypothetical protein